jgi:hypothetical protein
MIYHYSKAMHLSGILATGLRPSLGGVISRADGEAASYPARWVAAGVKPVLWFSTNPEWERTVFCDDAPSLQQAHLFTRHFTVSGLIRIVCNDAVAPHDWHRLKRIACISAGGAKRLVRSAERVYARPDQWRATLAVVPMTDFLDIESWNGAAWVTMLGDDLCAAESGDKAALLQCEQGQRLQTAAAGLLVAEPDRSPALPCIN